MCKMYLGLSQMKSRPFSKLFKMYNFDKAYLNHRDIARFLSFKKSCNCIGLLSFQNASYPHCR